MPLLLGAALTLAACGPGFDGVGDEPVDSVQSELCAAGPTLDGIDVSYWQQSINWASVKSAGKTYAIARAGHGLAADTFFARNWAGMKANGLIRGAYHFLVPNQSIQAQADIMIQAMATLGPDDLPPTLDVEEVDGVSPSQLASAAQQWVNAVKTATGRTPIVYTGGYFWNTYVQSSAFNKAPLWVAHYGVTCPNMPANWSNWAFHQYSSTGSVPGITGNVDLDHFNGTLAQLKGLIAGTDTVPVDPGTGTLTGAIYEGATSSNRIAGAVVTVGTKTVTTGTDGLYTFTLAPGTYTATVTKAGYASASVVRTVTSGTTIWGSMGITAAASTGTLSGLVFIADAAHPTDMSRPLAGTAITAGGQATATDATGKFSLSLPAGTYAVTATKAGYAQATLNRAVTSGATSTATIGLTAAATTGSDVTPPQLAIAFPSDGSEQDLAQVTVRGTASDDSGAVASLTLSVNGAAASTVDLTGGTFSVALKLLPGTNVLLFTAKDGAGNRAQLTQSVTFRAGVSGAVLRQGTTLKIPGSTVDLQNADGVSLGQAHTATGDFAIDVAHVPGEFVLVASAPGFITSRQAIHLTDEARLTWNLSLTQGVEAPSDELPQGPVDPQAITDTTPSAPAKGCAAVGGLDLGALLGLIALARRRAARR